MQQPCYKIIYVFIILMLLQGCVPVTQQAGVEGGGGASYAEVPLRFEDYVYSPNIQSVQCYVQSGHPEEVLNPPVISLSQDQPIVLEFDQVNAQQQRFVAKLIYCDADWKESRLTQSQYMPDLNEFYITDISPSYNTKVPYFHYRFRVPPVKLSGNYLLVVADQNGRNVLSRRILIYEQSVTVGATPNLTTGGNARFTNQQVDFNIFYPQYQLVNPAQEVKVVLRQNFRWDNAKQNIKPLYVRETERRLEYNFFELQHTFLGLNEYRFFDNRTRRALGANVAAANREVVPEEIRLIPEKSRAKDPFSQQIDINGRRVFGSRDFNNPLSSDYNWVTFQLAAPQPAPGNVYIFGELTGWKLNDAFKMQYDATSQSYVGRVYLKQGYYNYSYAVQQGATAPDETYFEGSFSNTENMYDILVYYRPPGTRTDLLIGYQVVPFNPRR
ncbi:DUF5103 domain-containing protein [Adhaeribacter aquaticus]|uniref:type IX secretion system plug protein n=1 Tax=Adhaeribacter aquaticus TaxID=299567 RepID=UPI00041F7964|nr:DUF5103 domain-containing protein [Adhaeribacter aquaticus]